MNKDFWIAAAIVLAVVNFALQVHQNKKIKKVMNAQDTLNKLVADLDQETNDIAAKVDAEIATLKDQAVSPESLAALSAISDRLKSLGSDPANPVPPTTGDSQASTGTEA